MKLEKEVGEGRSKGRNMYLNGEDKLKEDKTRKRGSRVIFIHAI